MILVKKIGVLLLFLHMGIVLGYGQRLSLLSDSLSEMIDRKQEFIQKKQEKISKIKQQLKTASLSEEYRINEKLYDEYQKLNVDSAIFYAKRNIEIALALGDFEKEVDASLNLSLSYSMGGMYREAEQLLLDIDETKLSRYLLANYYITYYSFWDYYSVSTSRNQYIPQKEKYLDLYLSVADRSSFDYKKHIANRTMEKNPEKAKQMFQELLMAEEEWSTRYAIITCQLACISSMEQLYDDEQIYFMRSAIADIYNATLENYSLQSLALISYKNHDLEKAFKYAQSAIDDALASGIQFRATQMYGFYTLISSAYQEREMKVKLSLIVLVSLLAVFALFFVVLIICIYRQMKKTQGIKEKLSVSNAQLQKLNDQLNDTNDLLNAKNCQLQETNSVKEQFIAQFFGLCSNYIVKMEEYQTSLYKLTVNRQYEKLLKRLKSTSLIDDELTALYNHFDSIFLNLYPTFVTDFNALLNPEERIVPKAGTLLNKELRIYALIRLGITDGTKIASFLRCSTSTVYNYRTKIRNKTIINKDEFEERILQIGNSGKIS